MDRKAEILMAAGDCFVKYGYEKTTLDDIAEIVGINKASFYYHFKNKDEIFKELIIKEADYCIQILKDKVEPISDYKEKILTWIKEGFNYNDKNSILHKLSMESIKKITPLLSYLRNYSMQKGIEYLSSVFQNYKDNNVIKIENPYKLASSIQNTIYALKENLIHFATSKTQPIKLNDIEDDIIFTVSLILDGIQKSS